MYYITNNKTVFIVSTLSLTGLVAGSSGCIGAEKITNVPKKNILMIAVDDMKPLIGCYGDELAITPNMDQLAANGIVFTSAYCQEAVSAPTRASLLTGLCPDRTKVWDLKTLIRTQNPDIITLPQYLKSYGYTTVGIGKIFDPRSVDHKKDILSWSIPFMDHSQYFNKDYGEPLFKEYQSEEVRIEYDKRKGKTNGQKLSKIIKPSSECIDIPDDAYTDGAVANGAIHFLENYNSEKPFFLAVGFKKPHLPFCAPKKYWDLYRRNDMPLAEFRRRAEYSPSIAYHKSSELHSYSDIPPLYSYSDIENTIIPDYKAKELIHGYYACISYTDAQIGKVIDALRKSGKAENTIIILWGDHGWHLGDHGLWNKHSNFEQATRVPFILLDPAKGNKVVTSPVEFLDIFPIICELIDVNIPSWLDGTSLVPMIDSCSQDSKKYAVSQYPRGNKMGYSIRNERYRYTIWVDWSDKKTKPDMVYAEELYDYLEDPNETINVIDERQYNEVLQLMRGYWREYQKKRL